MQLGQAGWLTGECRWAVRQAGWLAGCGTCLQPFLVWDVCPAGFGMGHVSSRFLCGTCVRPVLVWDVCPFRAAATASAVMQIVNECVAWLLSRLLVEGIMACPFHGVVHGTRHGACHGAFHGACVATLADQTA
eukprot:362741-Chlamydomonas_euryale.AAC.2